jgi:hypothetical protein
MEKKSMMRRRGFIRPMRLARQSRIPRHGNAKLIEANHLFQMGQYHASAILFEEVANNSQLRGAPNAPHLFLLAGRTWILDSAIEKGMDDLRLGLKLLNNSQRDQALMRVGTRLVEFLQRQELHMQAAEIESWLNENISGDLETSKGEKNKTSLPAACPTCGGPVHPSEITWENEEYPMCNYCGSLIDAKK